MEFIVHLTKDTVGAIHESPGGTMEQIGSFYGEYGIFSKRAIRESPLRALLEQRDKLKFENPRYIPGSDMLPEIPAFTQKTP